MKRKTWSLLCLGGVLGAFLFCSALVVFVDPFQVYRLATHYLPPIDNTTQVYANAGIVRNYDYDSAIVGSSVTENFRPSQMDAHLGGRFIKLCSSGGTAYNHALLLDLAFDTHAMRRVVYGLDVYSFVEDVDATACDVPMYLYDHNPFNDAQYWLNRSVLASFLPRCLRAWGQRQDDSIRDAMYCWAGRDDYGAVYALYGADFSAPETRKDAHAFDAKVIANLETNLIPFIEAHPETQFDFFFPPYSAAEWASMEHKGILEPLLTARGMCYDALCGYPNVTVHDFSAKEVWTLNLDNYKDTLHYGQWINDAIVENIAAGSAVVNSRAQLDEATAVLRRQALFIVESGGTMPPPSDAAAAP